MLTLKNIFSLTIAKKLWALVLFSTIGILGLTTVFALSERSLIMQERQSNVRQAVETAMGVVAYYHDQAEKGLIPESEAKQKASETIKKLRYSGDEYFFITDMQPVMIMHPIKPELDGKDVSANKDPNGKALFVEFVKTVKSGGGGIVDYQWSKPGESTPVPKTSYVKGYAPWGWIVGSGIYVDSVQTAFVDRLVKFGLIGLGFSLVLLVIGWCIGRSITRPLLEAVHVADTVAAGDLTSEIHVESNDETGQLLHALKSMNEQLLHLVSELRNGTELVSTAASQIAAGNVDLSSRTEEEASSLEETASAMEELASTVRNTALHAKEASALTQVACEVAGRGSSEVARAVDSMEIINGSAKKISDIIAVIDGIAFQTNILALNAAVEAARAGDQGRGFAVVAAEVRQLAQRSASAAKEIKTLITDSVSTIAQGAERVNAAGHTMDQIVENIQKVTAMMVEISRSTDEQTSGIEQINQAITQLDAVSQQNAALVEESAAAAESLRTEAEQLADVAKRFQV